MTCAVAASGTTYATIQAAVDDPRCTAISVAAGTYGEHITISRNVTITGAGAARTLLDGGGTNRVVVINNSASITLAGVTIKNGQVGTEEGGGIHVQAGTLTLKSSTVSGNRAHSGGGIAISRSSTATLTDSTVSGNHAAIYGGGIVNEGVLTVTKSAITTNEADNGGGIATRHGGTATVNSSTVTDNHARQAGGGMYLLTYFGGPPSAITLQRSTVGGNRADEDGGGIALGSGNSTVTVESSTIGPNTAGRDGGGIYHGGLAPVTLTNSKVSGNYAVRHGGGIGSFHSSVVLKGGTLAANRADGRGGGLYLGGPLTMSGSTFSANLPEDIVTH